MPKQQPTYRNRLLNLLSAEDRAALAPLLEPVDMPKSYEIATANKPISHCYFIETGLGSVVSVSAEGFKAEVGMVGRDGMLPTAAVLDCDSTPQDVMMQIGGTGLRIDAASFKAAVAERPALRRLMLRFVQTLTTQGAYTALSNAVHHTEERLARWLLMCHDRMDGKQLALTHEYVAILLAVRRPSVTTALHILEGNRLITAKRGLITIRDREGLERFAADAYGIPEAEYARLIGPLRAP